MHGFQHTEALNLCLVHHSNSVVGTLWRVRLAAEPSVRRCLEHPTLGPAVWNRTVTTDRQDRKGLMTGGPARATHVSHSSSRADACCGGEQSVCGHKGVWRADLCSPWDRWLVATPDELRLPGNYSWRVAVSAQSERAHVPPKMRLSCACRC